MQKLRDYQPKHSKCLCSEITFTNKKRICFSVYRAPKSSNLLMFLEELTLSLSKLILKYENLLIMSDFNTGINSKISGYDNLDEFCDPFYLTNLVKPKIRFAKNHEPLIYLFLTNIPFRLFKIIFVAQDPSFKLQKL